MASKKFTDRLKEQRTAEKKINTEIVEETAKNLMGKENAGEYKETTIKLRITTQEKELWKEYAKGQPLSAFIRDNVNYNIKKGITADDLLTLKK